MLEDFPKLAELEAEIARLRASHELLESVLAWYGAWGPQLSVPYNSSKEVLKEVRRAYEFMRMPDKLHSKLNSHFGFDDSE